jgi:hypothetical protein
MDSFWIYFACAIVTGWGFIIFLWWWVKVKKTTEVYKYVVILLFAEFLEKSIFAFLRGWGLNDTTIWIYRLMFSKWAWIIFTAPTTIAFGLLVFSMTIRIYRSYFIDQEIEK